MNSKRPLEQRYQVKRKVGNSERSQYTRIHVARSCTGSDKALPTCLRDASIAFVCHFSALQRATLHSVQTTSKVYDHGLSWWIKAATSFIRLQDVVDAVRASLARRAHFIWKLVSCIWKGREYGRPPPGAFDEHSCATGLLWQRAPSLSSTVSEPARTFLKSPDNTHGLPRFSPLSDRARWRSRTVHCQAWLSISRLACSGSTLLIRTVVAA